MGSRIPRSAALALVFAAAASQAAGGAARAPAAVVLAVSPGCTIAVTQAAQAAVPP